MGTRLSADAGIHAFSAASMLLLFLPMVPLVFMVWQSLLSTETAHRFYLARGYVDTGPSQRKFGTTASYPMMKMLVR